MTPSESDPIWRKIREEATAEAEREPMLASYFHLTILKHSTMEECLSYHLAEKLGSQTITAMSLREVFAEAMLNDPSIAEAARADIKAVRERDPACNSYIVPLLYFKGYQAIQAYRVAHWLWNEGRHALAQIFQSRISEIFSVDIHPAARIGSGVMIDHAHSIVIGETAVIEDNVSMLHEVTLGGTGKATGDRHPKVRSGVLIGAGAKVLGDVEIGAGAKIAGGSVVLIDVPPHSTAAGVPAVIIGKTRVAEPALEMDHLININKGSGI